MLRVSAMILKQKSRRNKLCDNIVTVCDLWSPRKIQPAVERKII